jgi:TPP-dependent pyruvate/acetoin dehydrogenase alpha subunit
MLKGRMLTQPHEALVAGASLELGPEDTLVASPRKLAAQIAKGTRLVCKNGDQVDFATASSSDSLDPFNFATGIALANRLEKNRNVVVALSAENSSSLERWHAAMKFAGIHKLPVIYVLSCSSAFERRAANGTPVLEELSFWASDCSVPAVIVDGNDAVAVWRVTQESIHRARTGAGPTLIECETRLTQYADPLAHMQHYMKKHGVWDDQWRQEVGEKIEAEIKAAPIPRLRGSKRNSAPKSERPW